MPKAASIQTNFTAGELSPRLEGRVDIAKYFNGVRTLKNMIIHTHGGASRRGGTKHISNSKSGVGKKVRLIPFQYSVEQAYMLEFGENYIHFYYNESKIGGGAFSSAFSSAFSNESSVYELTTTYLESELFEIQFVQTADLLYLVHPNHPPARLSRTSIEEFQLDDVEFDEPPFGDQNETDTTFTAAAVSGSTTITSTTSIFTASDVGRFVRIDQGSDYGIAEITAYTSETVVSVTTVKDFISTTAQKTWRLGSFSESTGYPSSLAFYEDRLMYGGTPLAPQTIWGSRSGIYNDFTLGADDDDAVQYTIASDQVNAIRWMSSGKSLVIGTVGGEFLLSASTSDEAITPSNIKIVRQSEYGSAYVLPIRTSGVVLFLQGSGRKIRQFVYEFESDSYIAPDLTLLSEHITGKGVTQLAYQREPDSTVWMTREDGSLIGMTYERDQEVTGWHRHNVGGVSDSLGNGAIVESVATIPKDGTDQIWLSVKRYINGETVRSVEVIEPGRDAIEPEDKNDFFVDNGVRYDGEPTMVVGGGAHLEGEEVQILADGYVVPSQVVQNGSITLEFEASSVNYGFGYVSEVETMRIEAGSANGTSQGKIKRINKASFRFYETLGAQYGPNENNLDIIPFRSTSDKMNSSPPRFSGDKEVSWNNGHETPGRILARQTQPLPFAILAIMPKLRTND